MFETGPPSGSLFYESSCESLVREPPRFRFRSGPARMQRVASLRSAMFRWWCLGCGATAPSVPCSVEGVSRLSGRKEPSPCSRCGTGDAWAGDFVLSFNGMLRGSSSGWWECSSGWLHPARRCACNLSACLLGGWKGLSE